MSDIETIITSIINLIIYTYQQMERIQWTLWVNEQQYIVVNLFYVMISILLANVMLTIFFNPSAKK